MTSNNLRCILSKKVRYSLPKEVIKTLFISDEMLLKLLQFKGMLSIADLSKQTGINRFTLTEIFTGKRKIVQKNTFLKLNDWLLQNIK